MVDVFRDGEIVTMDARQCKFDYRKSIFKRARTKARPVILGVYLSLQHNNKIHGRIGEKLY